MTSLSHILTNERRALVAVLMAIAVLGSGCDIFGTAIDERAPRLEILRPFDEATVSGRNVLVQISAEALGDDNFVSFINININGQRAGEAVFDGALFNFRFNSLDYPDGLYRIEAVAFDKFQARGISAPVLVTVQNQSDGPGPRMTIVDPETDQEVNGITRVVARTDPGEPFVTRVDLLVNGVAMASISESIGGNTFIFDWDTIELPLGKHVLEVKAYSGINVFRISESVTVEKTELETGGELRPGSLKWRAFGFNGEIDGAPGIGFNNDIYVGTSSDTLYSFTVDGALKWKFPTKGPIRSSPMVGNNEDIFVVSEDGRLYGLTNQGERLWGWSTAYNSGSLLRSSPTLGVDGVIYFGDSDGRVHAVSSFDGLSIGGRWPKKVSDAAIVVPPVIARDRTIIVASTDGFLYALDPAGQLLWKTQQNIGSVMVGMALIEKDITINLPTGDTRTTTANIVYAVSNDGQLYAVAGEDGSVLWSYPLTGPLRSGPVVGPDGTIYVGTSTGLIALNEDADAFTPRLRWVFVAENVGTPTIDSNGIVYFVGAKTLYAINPNNTPYWTYHLNTQSDGPLTITRSGELLVAGDNGALFSFETGSVGLAREKWPTFQRNARHTGRIGIDATDG
ncbi:MAG: PQQ-binding-like beta-propeller repeat protein [Rhodothermales bacterium]